MAAMAHLTPPEGFFPLTEMLNLPMQKSFNVCGIVTDTRPPGPTRGLDWKMTLSITSPELHAAVGIHVYEEISYFNRIQDHLPHTVNPGDVVLVRNVRKTGATYTSANPTFASTTTIFKAEHIPEVEFKEAYTSRHRTLTHHFNPAQKKLQEPSRDEQVYAIYLKSWANKVKIFGPSGSIKANPFSPILASASDAKRGLVKLSSVKIGFFYEVVAQVTKVWTNYDQTTIYITDYTENEFFWDHQAQEEVQREDWMEKSTNGQVSGKMILQVTLFFPNSDWAAQREKELVGSIVHIRNLNIQGNKCGENIEGKLHGDRKRENQVDIQILSDGDPRVKELIERRETYQSKDKATTLGQREVDSGALNKNQKKKKRQQAKKEREELEAKEKAREQRIKHESKGKEREDTVRAAAKVTTPFEAALGPNPNIASTHKQKPCQTLGSIIRSPLLQGKTKTGGHITYPFMNITFRAQVRVVDFYPPRLADFAQSLDDPRYNNAPDLTLDDDDDSMNLTPQSRWEWAFWITVEDALKSGEQTAPDRLRVLVHGKDAQYLLKLDACDLRRAPEVLRKLRDRLFLFWGELEEVKSKSKPNAEVPSPKNRLLECCIREYGVKDDDDKWIRMHRITGTTIQEE